MQNLGIQTSIEASNFHAKCVKIVRKSVNQRLPVYIFISLANVCLVFFQSSAAGTSSALLNNFLAILVIFHARKLTL